MPSHTVRSCVRPKRHTAQRDTEGTLASTFQDMHTVAVGECSDLLSRGTSVELCYEVIQERVEIREGRRVRGVRGEGVRGRGGAKPVEKRGSEPAVCCH